MQVWGTTEVNRTPAGSRGWCGLLGLPGSERVSWALLMVGIALLVSTTSLFRTSIALAQRDGMSYGIHGRTYAGMRHGAASVRTVHMSGDSGSARKAMGFHSGGDVHQRLMQSMDSLESRLVAGNAAKERLRRGARDVESGHAPGGLSSPRESAGQRNRTLTETRVKAAEAQLALASEGDSNPPWWAGGDAPQDTAPRAKALEIRSRDALEGRVSLNSAGPESKQPPQAKEGRSRLREHAIAPVKRSVATHAWTVR